MVSYIDIQRTFRSPHFVLSIFLSLFFLFSLYGYVLLLYLKHHRSNSFPPSPSTQQQQQQLSNHACSPSNSDSLPPLPLRLPMANSSTATTSAAAIHNGLNILRMAHRRHSTNHTTTSTQSIANPLLAGRQKINIPVCPPLLYYSLSCFFILITHTHTHTHTQPIA